MDLQISHMSIGPPEPHLDSIDADFVKPGY